jgi:hypothetical protein
MKKFVTILITMIVIWSAGYSWAQRRLPSAEGGRIHYSTLYKPGTVETIKGEVVSLGKTASGNGKALCEVLTLKTSKDNFWVILKPENYNPKINLNIQPGDQLEITGSKILLPGKTTIIAAQIKKGNETLTLRDSKTGRPIWAVAHNWHVQR